MTNRIDQLTSYVAENPLASRLQNTQRTTINPLARELQALAVPVAAQTVAPDPVTASVAEIVLGPAEDTVTDQELDTALELFQQQLITDIISPLTARISELEQTVALLEQRIAALE